MNYSEITQLALDYADRNDTEVTSKIDLFLKIVETRINRFLKTKDMSARTTIATVTDQEYYDLPSDFAGLRDIEFRESASSDKRVTLQYIAPQQMNYAYTANLKSSYYTIIGNQIQIHPAPETGNIIEIIYYQKLTPLTSVSSTNWLSNNNPDVYTFGLLVEINSFVKDAASKVLWDERFKEALAEIQLDDDKIRWSGPALQTRVM